MHEFQLKLVKELCRCTDDAKRSLNSCGDEEPPTKTPKYDPSTRMRGGFTSHTLTQFPATPTRKYSQKRCRVCQKKGMRRDTCMYCKECNVLLCANKCYSDYHSKIDY